MHSVGPQGPGFYLCASEQHTRGDLHHTQRYGAACNLLCRQTSKPASPQSLHPYVVILGGNLAGL